MMAEIVNLRLARKRKARKADAERADQNRALHGRTKAEKQRDAAERRKSATFLDGHRRAPSDPEE